MASEHPGCGRKAGAGGALRRKHAAGPLELERHHDGCSDHFVFRAGHDRDRSIKPRRVMTSDGLGRLKQVVEDPGRPPS